MQSEIMCQKIFNYVLFRSSFLLVIVFKSFRRFYYFFFRPFIDFEFPLRPKQICAFLNFRYYFGNPKYFCLPFPPPPPVIVRFRFRYSSYQYSFISIPGVFRFEYRSFIFIGCTIFFIISVFIRFYLVQFKIGFKTDIFIKI